VGLHILYFQISVLSCWSLTFSYFGYKSIVAKQVTLYGGRHRIGICRAKSSRRSKSTWDCSARGGGKEKKTRRKKELIINFF